MRFRGRYVCVPAGLFLLVQALLFLGNILQPGLLMKSISANLNRRRQPLLDMSDRVATMPAMPDVVARDIERHKRHKGAANKNLDDWRKRPIERSGSDQQPVCPHVTRPPVTRGRAVEKFHMFYEDEVFLFAAYYDARKTSPAVKVMGVADMRSDMHPRFCQVWFSERQSAEVVRIDDRVNVPETHDKRFGVFLYTCNIKSTWTPYAVTITREGCYAKHKTTLHVVQWKSPTIIRKITRGLIKADKANITACINPLFNTFNDANSLVEMIEVNSLFGIDKFVLYNLSSGGNIDKYVRYYVETGKLSIIQWPIFNNTSIETTDIHYNGQLAAINDCLYRHLDTTRYITFLDLDEFLVTRTGNNLMQMIEKIQSPAAPEKYCSYTFQNVFYRLDWNNFTANTAVSKPMRVPRSKKIKMADIKQMQSLKYLSVSEHMVAKHGLRTLSTWKREDKIWPHGFRSKYISPISLIELAGVHLPWICSGPRYDYFLASGEALLHHYRKWDNGGDQTDMEDSVVDKTMQQYKEQIINSVHNVHRMVRNLG